VFKDEAKKKDGRRQKPTDKCLHKTARNCVMHQKKKKKHVRFAKDVAGGKNSD
jgi:hypothetical protein